MKKTIAISLICIAGIINSNAQQYGWKNITANLPDFHNDTVIINGGADTLIANISGISFLDDNQGWICTYHPFDGEPSAVLQTTDGGQTWTEHSAPLAGQDIYMINADTGYFGAYNGMIYKTADAGETWTYHGHLNVALYDLEFPPRPAQNGYAGGKDGHLSRITPEGVFPFSLGLNGSVYSISFPNEEEGWALLDYQLIIQYQDSAWISNSSHPYSSKSWLFCLDNHLGWCVGEHFLLTTNGQDWIQVDPNFVQTGSMMGVFFTDPDNGWAVGTQGQIAFSTNGGNNWTKLDHNLTNAMLTGVLFTSPTNGYIIGGNKSLLKYGPTSGITDQPEMDFKIFPNPARDKCMVQSTKCKNKRCEILLSDVFGRSGINFFSGMFPEEGVDLDVSSLPAGIYFVRISDHSSVAVKKLVKQ